MRLRTDGSKRVALLLTMLAVVLGIGAAAYAYAAAGSAAKQPSVALSGGPNRPAGQSASTGNEGPGYPPAVEKTYPNGVRVSQDVKHDLSPPLRDIVPLPPVAGGKQEAPENPRPFDNSLTPLKDTMVQRFFGPLAMPTPILTFDGIDAAGSACGCLPPDTNGDVGPNHYVQTVNVAFRIWNKSGTPLSAPTQINTLFSGFGGPCQTSNSGDPVVNYDGIADRWVINQFTASAPYYQCYAVSQTPDPLGAYHRYAFLMSNTDLYDYPKTSVWPDAYYMSANAFTGGNSFSAPHALAFNRTAMLQGLPASYQDFNPGNFYFGIMPGDLDGTTLPPAGAPNPFVTTGGTNTSWRMWEFHVDFATPANSTFAGPITLGAAPFDPDLCGGSRNCIPQPNTVRRLDAFGGQTMYRFAYRNLGGHDAAIITHAVDENGSDHAAVRWYEIRNVTTAPYIYQQGTYSPDADNRWLSSGAMDRDGNIAVGYSTSSATTFPSLRYAGRLVSDPLNTLGQGEATLHAGTGSQTSSSGRWGDYAAMQVDPTDDCTFWFTSEYYQTTAGASWKTRIGSFKFPSCGTPQPTPTGVVPTMTPLPPTSTPVAACGNYAIATGTAVVVPGVSRIDGAGCDDCSIPLTLPFPVTLYNQTFTNGYVTSNGNLQFGSSDFAFGNACLPVPIFDHTILAYWDDLITSCTGCGIFTSTTGSPGSQIFNIEWRSQVLSDNSNANFEIRLYEGLTRFDIIYGVLTGGGTGQTIGVQLNSTTYTQYSCDTASVTPGLLLTFDSPPCPTATATVTPVQATATRTPGAATPTPQNCTVMFTDVDPTNPFYPFVRCLACRGIISGYGDGSFRPNNTVTRGQVAKMAVNAAGFGDVIPSGQQTFSDVPHSNPFWYFIEVQAGRGYISGYADGTFRPNNSVTRGQLAKIDANTAQYTDIIPSTQQTFEDVPYANPFWVYIERVSTHGVISGYGCGGAGEPCNPPGNRPYFRTYNSATRGQTSKIVANTFYPGCQTPSR